MKFKFTIRPFLFIERQLLTIMKTFIFLLCTTVFSFNVENTFSQEKVTIDQTQMVKVDRVFKIIKKQTNYDFIYPKGLFNSSQKVQLEKGEILVTNLLKLSLSNNNLIFEISQDNVIIIKENPEVIVLDIPNVEEIQSIEISGNIMDSEGQPLPGASVLEKGTTNGTETDFDGNFLLDVTDNNATLVISFLGYLTTEIPLNGQSTISVKLEEDTANLEEIVVIGYGTVKKSDLTGAVSSVKAEDLPLSTSPSIEQALISQAAGLTVQSTSGQPGAGVNILIRGAANQGASNAPLYVIDGFPMGGGVDIGSVGRFGDSGHRSPLNDINPNDIANIEILKDASATSIYGARAANGVILITTKRGKEGKVKVEYSANYTHQKIDQWLDLLNATDYMTERNEVLIDNGNDAAYTPEEIANAPETTDWFDNISRDGFIHQQNISVSGGSNTSRYLASVNYFDQEGVIKNSNLNRITGRINLDQDLGDRVSFGISVTASSTKNGNVPLGAGGNEFAAPIRSSIDFSPITPVRDEDGNFSKHPIGSFSSTLANPVSLLDIDDETVIDRLLANAFVDVKIIEGLTGRVKVGIDKRSALRSFYSPTTNIFGAQDNGDGSKYYNQIDDQLFGATLNYSKEFEGGHTLNLLAGYEYQQFSQEGVNARNTNFITDGLLYNDLNAGIGDPVVGSFKSFSELASYFGRAFYSYKGKYLVTASIRRDGSPKFGENNRWGVFPSASVAWRVSEESFLEDSRTISNLKLRLGYGQTGNDAVAGATALYQTRGNYIYGSANQAPEFGVQQTRYANPDLKWQTNTEINVGVDFGLFKNRISGSIDYFNKEITDLLGTKQLKTFLPISTIAFNVGATKSSGVEFSLSTRNLVGEFKWDTNFNIGTFKDRWTERDPNAILQPYQSGTDLLGSQWIYNYEGIQQENDPIPVHQPNIKPGQPRVSDLNGVDDEGNLVAGPDGQITPADRIFIGTTAPGYTFGLTNNFRYKGFDLGIVMQGMGDLIRYNSTRAFYLLRASSLREGRNVLAEFTNRWTPENPDSEIPSGTVNSTPGASDRLFWEDASFMRIKNITFGYTLPDNVLGNGIDKLRLYVDAQNAFIFTNYKGMDPEFDNIGAYPNQKSFTIGLNVTF